MSQSMSNYKVIQFDTMGELFGYLKTNAPDGSYICGVSGTDTNHHVPLRKNGNELEEVISCSKELGDHSFIIIPESCAIDYDMVDAGVAIVQWFKRTITTLKTTKPAERPKMP